MNISKYHLIQYVLKDESLVNCNAALCESKMKEVSKIFRGKIPNSLLHGLVKKNNEKLSCLCHEYLLLNQENELKTKENNQRKEEKFELWKTKLKIGNEKAKLKKLQDTQINTIEEQERQREYNQCYIKQMQSAWDSQLEAVIQKRSKELFATFQPFKPNDKTPSQLRPNEAIILN